jgi:hypothetical protein
MTSLRQTGSGRRLARAIRGRPGPAEKLFLGHVFSLARAWCCGGIASFALCGASAIAQSSTPGLAITNLPAYVYPFPAYADPRVFSTTSAIPPIAFLAPVNWSDTNGVNACELSAAATSGQMWLQLATSNTAWQGAWRLGLRDGTEIAADTNRTIAFASLPRAAYTLDIWPDAGFQPLPTLWVAWPTNTIPVRRFPASGYLHGKFENKRLRPLHIWGHASEPVAAGLWGGCGVTQAWLRVDGRQMPLTLDDAGNFDLTVSVTRGATKGVHEVALWTVSACQDRAFATDVELVSEYSAAFAHPPPLPPDGWRGGGWWWNGGCSSWNSVLPPFIPSGIAVAFPRLDERGFLLFDGSESIGSSFYRWTVCDLVSNASYSMEGRVVSTEQLPAGIYAVSLDCHGKAGYFSRIFWQDDNGIFHSNAPDDPFASQAVGTFTIVIPPRIPPSARRLEGALHARWTPDRTNGRHWVWSVYLSGHVFDNYGASIFGYSNGNLDAAAFINGSAKDLSLNDAGCFRERWVVGAKLETSYTLDLHAGALDNADDDSVDSTSDTNMPLFPYWSTFYKLR